ncbi:MAG: hypothetical protein FJ267_02450 [Planctomycetes bacterium]|nr:hypothetical protein [Planctomycetota bacterium]
MVAKSSRPEVVKQYDDQLPWSSSNDLVVCQKSEHPFRCPSSFRSTYGSPLSFTDYALVTGPGTIFPTRHTVLDLKSITDGKSNTLFAVECAGMRIPWTEPQDLDVTQAKFSFNELNATGGSDSLLSSNHRLLSKGYCSAYACFADGAVRQISSKIDPTVLRAMTTANAGDAVGDF